MIDLRESAEVDYILKGGTKYGSGRCTRFVIDLLKATPPPPKVCTREREVEAQCDEMLRLEVMPGRAAKPQNEFWARNVPGRPGVTRCLALPHMPWG